MNILGQKPDTSTEEAFCEYADNAKAWMNTCTFSVYGGVFKILMGDLFTVKNNRIVFDDKYYFEFDDGRVDDGVYCACVRLGSVMAIKCPCKLNSRYSRIGHISLCV